MKEREGEQKEEREGDREIKKERSREKLQKENEGRKKVIGKNMRGAVIVTVETSFEDMGRRRIQGEIALAIDVVDFSRIGDK